MEEKEIENIQNKPVEQTEPTMPNTTVTPVEENKTNNKKSIISIIFGVATMLIIVGIILVLLYKNQEKKTEELLTSLGITDYFKYVLTTDYKKDVNLLDINNEEQMFMYYYYNKNTKIYKIDFQDPTFEGNLFLTYAKYDDYMKYHEKVFGVKSKHEMSIYDISIEELESLGKDVYHVKESVPIQCQYEKNTNNCYIKLTKDIDNKDEVELSNLKLEDNIITGTVTFKSKTEDFEFIFEEIEGNKIIKTLKIVDNI